MADGVYSHRFQTIAQMAREVAIMEYWNRHMKCWIKRGSKGIALIDEDLDSGKLNTYLHDFLSSSPLVRALRRPCSFALLRTASCA